MPHYEIVDAIISLNANAFVKTQILERAGLKSAEVELVSETTSSTRFFFEVRKPGQPMRPIPIDDEILCATFENSTPPYMPTLLAACGEAGLANEWNPNIINSATGIVQSLVTDEFTIVLQFPDFNAFGHNDFLLCVEIRNGSAFKPTPIKPAAIAAALRLNVSPMRGALWACDAAVEAIAATQSKLLAPLESKQIDDVVRTVAPSPPKPSKRL